MWFDNFPFSQTFHFGAVAVNPYGLAYLVSFLVAYTWLLRKESREPLALSSHDVQRLLFYCLVAVLLGGRCAFLVADAWHDATRVQYYLEHPVIALAFWLPGRTSFGGIAAVVFTLAIFSFRKGVRYFERLGDEVVVTLPLSFALVRIATFVTGSIPGSPCVPVHPWCVRFDGFVGLRYPATLIEASIDLLTFPIVLWIHHRSRVSGATGWSWIVIYAIGRFIAETWREPGGMIWFFTDGQVAALVMMGVGGTALAYVLSRAAKHPRAVAERQPS
jgi:phosphatidylglycerol---prolipoprotein diacylglyceryl transferase